PFLCRRCSQLYADAGLPALLTVGPARGGKIGNIAGCSYRASLTRRGGVAIVWARHFYLASGRRGAPIWPRCRYRGALRLLFRYSAPSIFVPEPTLRLRIAFAPTGAENSRRLGSNSSWGGLQLDLFSGARHSI